MNLKEWETIAQNARFNCNHPEKKKYATKELAELHIHRTLKKHKDIKLRVYNCSYCFFWHLSSH